MYFYHMKLINKVISILISFILIYNQLGFNLNLHLCGGNLSSISFIDTPKKCSMHHFQSMESKPAKNFTEKNCCQDTQLSLISVDSQIKSVFETNFQNFKLENKNLMLYFPKSISLLKTHRFWDPPPPNFKTEIYIFNGQLLFYG